MRARAWLIAGATLVAALSAPGTARATFHGTNGRIAFDDWVTGQAYAMNPDGTGLVQLTHVNADRGRWAGDPAWSPDGSHIAYEANKHGEVRLWVMDADGGNKVQISHGRPNTFDLLPVYTPVGSHLIFQRFRFVRDASSDEGGFWTATIQSIAVDGTDRQGLTTTTPPIERFDFDPSVSPDGQSIVFSRSNRNITGVIRQLFLMDIDGSNQHSITPPRFEAWFPDWSPDGTHVVFTDNSDRIGSNGWVMDADGSNITMLTSASWPHNDDQLQYSPDGTKIVFGSDRNTECCDDLFFIDQMFVMDANGTGQTLVDTGTPAPHDFAWGTAASVGGASGAAPVSAVRPIARLRKECASIPAQIGTDRCSALLQATKTSGSH